MIPFSPPRIDDEICAEVLKVLRSGWITTGPLTKKFEKQITAYCGCASTICLNSATAGLEIMLRWFGVTAGDEVILPAYTYAATANVIIHCGATPVFADVNSDDFNISVSAVEKAITSRTKVIMPVDFGGLPCDYKAINNLVEKHRKIFKPTSKEQEKLGRILVLADAAHSFGAEYNGKKSGSLTDVSVFSFHAVKNLTTAEGGAIALNLPEPFRNSDVYVELCVKTLHGQNKDALAKSQKGNWKYDIVEPGYKCNMTDISAAIGLVEIGRYENDTLRKRQEIVKAYDRAFADDERFELPIHTTDQKTSSFHLYPLRIREITEKQRDEIIRLIFEADVSVNVHFIPVPGTSYYRKLGYDPDTYPVAKNNFQREISLPVFYDLNNDQLATVVCAVKDAVNTVC